MIMSYLKIGDMNELFIHRYLNLTFVQTIIVLIRVGRKFFYHINDVSYYLYLACTQIVDNKFVK